MLEDIRGLSISPEITKCVIMSFEPDTGIGCGLKMTKEQFILFRELLISRGFVEVENKSNFGIPGYFKIMLLNLGFMVTRDDRRLGLIYVHTSAKKLVSVIYAEEDEVVIYRISYFEVK